MIGLRPLRARERCERRRVGDAGARDALPLLEGDDPGLGRRSVEAVDHGRVEIAERRELLLQGERRRRLWPGRSRRARGRGDVGGGERGLRQRNRCVDAGEQADGCAALDQDLDRTDAGHRRHGADDLVEPRERRVDVRSLEEALAEIDRRDVAGDHDAPYARCGGHVRAHALCRLSGCRAGDERSERVVDGGSRLGDPDELVALAEEDLDGARCGRAAGGRSRDEQQRQREDRATDGCGRSDRADLVRGVVHLRRSPKRAPA